MPLANEIDPADVEDDEAYCTEFVSKERSVEGDLRFAFICPRCDAENLLEGDPMQFAKPFRCLKCNWVSLLVYQSLAGIAEEAEGEATDA